MKIEKVDNLKIAIEINGHREVIAAPDLISSLAATIGPEHLLEDLSNGLLELSHSLFKGNQGTVGTELYDEENPEAGRRLEAIAGAAASALSKLRVPEAIPGEYGSPWANPAGTKPMPGTIDEL